MRKKWEYGNALIIIAVPAWRSFTGLRISLKKKNKNVQMKRFAAYITYLNFYFFLSTSVSANIRLPAVIGSHMVLQQRSEVTIWGWCDVDEKIKLKTTWDTTTYTTTGSTSAKWEIKISTPP